MVNLDDQTTFERYDATQFVQGLKDFPDQLSAAWLAMSEFALPTHYLKSQHVVVLAAPDHRLAAAIAQELASVDGSIPVVASADGLPNFVTAQSLIIALDYTGNSPDIVRAFQFAAQRQARLVAVSSGGELGSLCRKYRVPHYAIHYGTDPATANGYMIMVTLGVLGRLSFLSLGRWDDLPISFAHLPGLGRALAPETPTDQNRAKMFAAKFYGAMPLILTGRGLRVLGSYWRQQLQRWGGTWSLVDDLATVAHTDSTRFAKEGALHRPTLIIASTDEEDARTARRRFDEAQVPSFGLVLEAPTQLGTLLAGSLWADYTSYYLAMLSGRSPAAGRPVATQAAA